MSDFIIQSGRLVDEHYRELENIGDMTDQFDEMESIRHLLLKEQTLGNFSWQLSNQDMDILREERCE